MSRVWVAGEALIDLIPVAGGEREPMVGGGPANTAKAVSRLGYETSFIGGISTDIYGRAIEEELVKSGVDISQTHRTELPTALAIASIDENGLASYEFELTNTATFAFNRSWLPEGEVDVVHIGSVATVLEPGASELLQWARGISSPIIFDPNVRPSIEANRDVYRTAIERWIDIATIVKLSDDDLSWVYSERESAVVSSWLDRGVEIVVVTAAERGLRAYKKGLQIEVPAARTQLVDSVGAGDTIGAVIIEGVLQHGISGFDDNVLQEVLTRAARAAAITCSRAGANPPWREELDGN